MYTKRQLSQFKEQSITEPIELKNLAMSVLAKAETLSGKSKEHAIHGIARRLLVIRECLFSFFELLPPDILLEPKNETRQKVNVNLHAFLINVCGILDNMAWLLVYEKEPNRIRYFEKNKIKVGLFRTGFHQYLPNNWI